MACLGSMFEKMGRMTGRSYEDTVQALIKSLKYAEVILQFGIYPIQTDRPEQTVLILKMPRKPASENVVCLCRLLNILANFSNLFLHTGKQSGP